MNFGSNGNDMLRLEIGLSLSGCQPIQLSTQ